jgi:1-acyl-sn-glycerol-3-phosphate acyltransferase
MNLEFAERFMPIFQALSAYHKHEVVGLHHLPKKGPVILAVNHSLATYDISLLALKLYHETNRIPHFLADHLFFKIPFVREFVDQFGAIEGTPKNAKDLLAKGEVVVVAPGGMREALRPSSERYQLMWERRLGFVKLALMTGTPIMIGVCPRADDIFDVYKNKLTAMAYRKFRIPLILARGVGPSIIPRPSQLVHFLSEPIVPPKVNCEDPLELHQQLNKFHKKVVKRAEALIGEAIAYKP